MFPTASLLGCFYHWYCTVSCGQCCESASDPNPTFHFYVDPDPDLSFQIKAQNLENCSKRLIFYTLWLVISILMPGPDHFDVDPDEDSDPAYHFDADPCGSGSTVLPGSD
jgi:hypothetical protein